MNIVKDIALVAVGAAAGFAGGWLLTKRKYEKQAEDDINDIRQYYMEREAKKNDEINKEAEKIDEAIKEAEQNYESNSKIQYSKIANGSDEVMRAEKESPEEDAPTKPYIITQDEYLNGENDYEKLSLTYYSFDDTLADECDEMIDIEETISSDIFNELPDCEDDVYVRNPETKTDYEVMRIDGSFHDRYYAGGY